MSYQHLSAHERYVIFILTQYGLNQAEIARRLGRSPSTISRERRRGQDVLFGYNDRAAEHRAQTHRHRARHRRRADRPRLVAYVQAKLRAYWPPQTIAARVQLNYPDSSAMRISAEPIYQWLFTDARGGGD